jgi:hypothetical protein
MKTDALIDLLAADAAPVERRALERRLALGLSAGTGLAAAMMWLGLGLRPDLSEAAHQGMFWGKLMFTALVSLAALAALICLSLPGRRLGWSTAALATPFLVVWAAAAWLLWQAPAAERPQLVLGSSWAGCPLSIALLSLPLLAGAFWILKGLAPTRLTWAGAGGGLLAGGIAASLYALHCTESEVPFLAVWYVAGMAIPAVLGTLLAPRLLRW